MKILSLFDGMSCGQLAFHKAGIPVKAYHASDINPYASSVTRKHYPYTVHLGDVKDVRPTGKYDWLIGGSPCQSFSFAGKRKGMTTKDKVEVTSLEQYLKLKADGFSFEGESYLFWEYIRIREEVKPRFMLLENVRMSSKWEGIINGAVGFEPVKINSSLVSAQRRARLYWVGELQQDGTCKAIDVPQPDDLGITMKDIAHEFIDVVGYLHTGKAIKYLNKVVKGDGPPRTHWEFGRHSDTHRDKAACVLANIRKGVPYNVLVHNVMQYIVPFDKSLKVLRKAVSKGKVGYFRKDSQANRVYFSCDKAITLCGAAGGGAAKMGQYLFGKVHVEESGILDATATRLTLAGLKFYTLKDVEGRGVLIEGYIRKLTPVEVERLQTVPDGWTATGTAEDGSEVELSKTQRYAMLGNGWTVDVIAHILRTVHHGDERI